MFRGLAYVAAALVVFASYGAARGEAKDSARPTMFSSSGVIERAWKHDHSIYVHKGQYCTGTKPNFKDDECNYIAHGVQVQVTYNQNRAVTFWMGGSRGISPYSGQYWNFLVSLMPPGAHRKACEMVWKSDQGGPAWVCLYAYKGQTLVVADYLHPGYGGDHAHVQRDFMHLGFQSVAG